MARDPLTFGERKEIERLLRIELSFAEIARRINRSKTAVTVDVRKVGGREGYTAELSILRTKEAQHSKKKLLAKSWEKQKSEEKVSPHPYCKIIERLNTLEEHVKIIYDLIEGLNK